MVTGALLLLGSVASAAADDVVQALVFTVHPSRVLNGPAGETLDEKLARRDRSFRFICLGCVRADGRVDSAPFYPVRTLNAPQLTAALAAEARGAEAGILAEERGPDLSVPAPATVVDVAARPPSP